MSSESPPPRIKPIGEALGFHEIMASVRQLSFMKQHSQTLLDTLSVVLETTYAKSPSGRQAKGQTYELQRNEKPDPSVRERLLEKLIWMGWRFQAVAQHGQPFLGEVCQFIQTYQMPLQGTRKDARWGKIDLVGATPAALPAVIELKQEGATDTPLRMNQSTCRLILPLLVLQILTAGCKRDPGTLTSPVSEQASGPVVILTDSSCQREVLESEQPVLVDMWAPWCQPCIAMKPTIRELAEELIGEVKVAELNIDENPFIKEKYEVDRYPMLLIFNNGVEVKRLIGLQSKRELVEALRVSTQTNE